MVQHYTNHQSRQGVINVSEYERNLQQAQQGKYAVAAFNVYNLETAQAAIRVAEQENQPVIIALGERYFPTVDVEGFAAFVIAMAEKSPVPVALHLDHAYEKESIIRAIRCGFTSVMFDGSAYRFRRKYPPYKRDCRNCSYGRCVC